MEKECKSNSDSVGHQLEMAVLGAGRGICPLRGTWCTGTVGDRRYSLDLASHTGEHKSANEGSMTVRRGNQGDISSIPGRVALWPEESGTIWKRNTSFLRGPSGCSSPPGFSLLRCVFLPPGQGFLLSCCTPYLCVAGSHRPSVTRRAPHCPLHHTVQGKHTDACPVPFLAPFFGFAHCLSSFRYNNEIL